MRWFLFILCLFAPLARAADLSAVHGVLERLLPHQAGQFELALTGDAAERFRVSADGGHIRVEGGTPSAVLFGVNWYLKYSAHVQISTDGNKDWAGLTRDYYRKRWELFFKDPAKPIDWYHFGEKWNHSGKVYSDQPQGDTYQAAKEIARFLKAAPPKD